MTATTAEASPRRRRGLPALPPLLATRLAHGLLWLLVAVAAVAGVAALALQAGTDPAGVAAEPSADPTAAAATAEAFVWAYLGQAGRGNEAAVEGFLADPVDLREVTPGSLYVARTAVVAANEQAPGYWAVTIAADTLAATEEGYEPRALAYYAVGVAETAEGHAVTGPPSITAPPAAPGEAPDLAVATIGRPQASEELEAAQRFLLAFLAGDGELDRYTAPGLQLSAVSPPPYTSVSVQRSGLARRRDGTALLRLEVAATEPAGHTQVLGYHLDVTRRAGRWEVTALHPAAPLPPGTAS